MNHTNNENIYIIMKKKYEADREYVLLIIYHLNMLFERN